MLMLCYEDRIIKFPRLLGNILNYCHLAQGVVFHFTFYWASQQKDLKMGFVFAEVWVTKESFLFLSTSSDAGWSSC